jgi:hypothetical protein
MNFQEIGRNWHIDAPANHDRYLAKPGNYGSQQPTGRNNNRPLAGNFPHAAFYQFCWLDPISTVFRPNRWCLDQWLGLWIRCAYGLDGRTLDGMELIIEILPVLGFSRVAYSRSSI